MSISDKAASVGRRDTSGRICRRFLIASAFTAFFAAVYEHFSHEVYSNYMIFAFLIPLIGGFLPALLSYLLERRGRRVWMAAFRGIPLQLYEYGLTCLTFGSLFAGILEIYGTTNRLIRWYPIAGIALITTGIVLFLCKRRNCH